MLRITTHKNSGSVKFQLEGKLAGPWVAELESCYRRIAAGQEKPAMQFDLTAVTCVDAAGNKATEEGQEMGECYDHDNCNSEVLLTRTSVQDGRIVLADGMSYRVLVLPDGQPMPRRAKP